MISLAFVLVSATFASTTIPLKVNVTELPWMCLKLSGSNMSAVQCGEHNQFKAKARYLSDDSKYGWNYLEIVGATADSWFDAGFIEGYLTHDKISAYRIAARPNYTKQVYQVVKSSLMYVVGQAKSNRFMSEYWKQVYNLVQQLTGMTEGYNRASGSDMQLIELVLLNGRIELDDIDVAVKVQDKSKVHKNIKEKREGSHCSGLIKVLPHDLYIAHDAWNVYNTMVNRFYKVYDIVGYAKISMSSYTANIQSFDDWYQIHGYRSSKPYYLNVIETTNDIFNNDLYKQLTPETVPEFMRVMIANYLARNPKEWSELFSLHNSGTYNNQFMILDMTKYTPGQPIQKDTFWVLEQIPGLVVSRDMSAHLQKYGYWASYNIPFFKKIYDRSGYPQQLKTYGESNSYTMYSRARIFKRNETDVHDIPSMMRLMRYNDYKHDPYSRILDCKQAKGGKCDPPYSSMNAISSRGDLMPDYTSNKIAESHLGINYFGVGFACFGAIDSKIATWSNRESQNGYVISGPTSDGHPPFSFGGNCPKPAGAFHTYDFPWVSFEH